MLISIIGQDSAGDLLLQHWQSLQLPCDGILRKGGVSTPMTSYIFNQGKSHARRQPYCLIPAFYCGHTSEHWSVTVHLVLDAVLFMCVSSFGCLLKQKPWKQRQLMLCCNHCIELMTLLGDCASSESICIYAGGDVAASVADVKTVEDHLKPADLQPFHSHLQQASIMMLDANLSLETLEVTTPLCSVNNAWYSIHACTLKCSKGHSRQYQGHIRQYKGHLLCSAASWDLLHCHHTVSLAYIAQCPEVTVASFQLTSLTHALCSAAAAGCMSHGPCSKGASLV
jgi:hypothetical protein